MLRTCMHIDNNKHVAEYKIFFLLRYDAEATFFDEGVRSSKRKQLEEKLLQVVTLDCSLP